jgi:tetratricopeptide (TPR) repeat protein
MNAKAFLLLVPAFFSLACINVYKTRLNGHVEETDNFAEPHIREIDTAYYSDEADLAWKEYRATGSIEAYSDYASALIFLGKYEDAKRIFYHIERQSPGRYTTAINLGTLYELIGNLDSAYYYTKQGVAIHPDSHEHSEWIHLKILEARIARSKNAGPRQSILALNFGDGVIPTNPDSFDLYDLHSQLSYQLNERTKFVKPKDLIVGELLFDLGNITAQTDYLEDAIACYELAAEYGYASKLMDDRLAKMRSMAVKGEIFNEVDKKIINPTGILLTGVGGLIMIFAAIYFVRRRSRS